MNVNGLTINNLFVSNSNGTSPMAGIDFEPNGKYDQIDNIVLNNVQTFNNEKRGILIHLNNIVGSGEKRISMKINNYTDDGSFSGITFSGIPKGATGLMGGIEYNIVNLKNNHVPMNMKAIPQTNFTFNIKNVSVISPKNSNFSKKSYQKMFKTLRNFNVKFK
jgi:hypothetical protein